jgi:RNA polymerase sigma-70 factor, Bacteroides expansion family 1
MPSPDIIGIKSQFHPKNSYFHALSLMQNERLLYLQKAIADNDELAFSELYRYFFPGLRSFAHSIIKDTHRSEEVIEDVFVKLWNNRQNLPAIQNVSHYLYTAVKHASLNCIARDKTPSFDAIGDDFHFEIHTPEQFLIAQENLDKITQAINSLPQRCKLIFRLVKEENLRYSEVAELLEISVKTVDAQLCIAVNKIAEVLKNSLPEFKHYYKSKKN